MKLPDREELLRLLRPRRNRILLAVLALLLIVRIGLPYVLRSVIVSQADEALVGRIELEDLDLALIRGGVELEGLSVHVDERPSTEPALFEAKRLWTQISWLALFTKTIEVEEFELEGFAVRLDRLKDGLLLPRLVVGEAAEEVAEQEEVASDEPLGWSFAADAVALRNGEIHVRDYTVDAEPHRFDLAVKDLSAEKLELRIDPSGAEPGRLVIQAQVGQGLVGLDAQVTQHAAGPGAVSKLELANLPIDKVRVYLTMFGWSDLSGKLDAAIDHRFEPGGVHEIGGVASLSEVSVRVPGLDRPALGFEKLKVALDVVDVVKQNAAVSEVALIGARVVVDAKSKTKPVPAIAPRESAEPAPAPAEPPAAQPEAPAKPWTWSVRTARVERALVELEGGSAPLPLGIDAEVKSISSEPGSRWPLTLRVAEGAGTLGVDGTLAIEPLAFEGVLAIRELALQPLLSRIDAPAVGLVRQGTARAEIAIALAEDLRVAGTLGVAGLDVGDVETAKEFGVAWKDFELGIGEITVPGVLGGGDPAAAKKIGVKLDLVRLVEPAFKVTRTAQGIVLPSFGGETAETAKPDEPLAAAAPESPAAPPAPATEIALEIASARIDAARAQVSDRSVTPFFSTRIERLDARARGIRWPGPRVEHLTLALLGLSGAKLDVSGAIIPGNSKLEAKLVKLPLAQFNPYVTPTGYGLSDGSLSLEATATVKKDVYETSTDVVVSQLEVGGSEGEALFQQSFGIPLSVALGLLKDLDGNITLAVPVDGDRDGVRVGLGTIVGQALRSALLGALASPLKLLGAVTADGKLKTAPEPIPFLPGDAVLTAEGAAQISRIAGLLSSTPGIALTLSGGISESDLRVLRERALYTELDATSGVRALGQLGAIATRRAVRLFLASKLASQQPEPLEPDEEAWLEEHVAQQSLEPAALAALANARAVAVQTALARDHGIADSRLTIGTPATEPPAAKPGVLIGLGAASKSAKPT
ncbi:MAG: DUF748 domain-containing protein [Myxococcota bacterium]